MAFDDIRTDAAPEHSPHQRRATKARVGAYVAAWKGIAGVVSAAVRRLAEAHRRLRNARSSYRELQALDDRQLKDIGLSRSDIREVAEAVADAAPDSAVTLAELRGVRAPASAGEAGPASLPSDDRRRGRAAPGQARPAAERAAKRKRGAV